MIAMLDVASHAVASRLFHSIAHSVGCVKSGAVRVSKKRRRTVTLSHPSGRLSVSTVRERVLTFPDTAKPVSVLVGVVVVVPVEVGVAVDVGVPLEVVVSKGMAISVLDGAVLLMRHRL